jgi:hypothetical protein
MCCNGLKGANETTVVDKVVVGGGRWGIELKVRKKVLELLAAAAAAA